jgi:hypothetical protein
MRLNEIKQRIEMNKLARANTPLTKELKEKIKTFLFLYCETYESKDLNKFAALFSSDATENGTSFHEVLPEYRKNFEIIDSFNYRIELDSISQLPELGRVRLKGKYFIRFMKEGKLNERSDNISMELIEHGDSFMVKELNYSSKASKIEDAQPKWGPWQNIESKK